MRLFMWAGDDIGDEMPGGVLIVLAETVEEARAEALRIRALVEAWDDPESETDKRRNHWYQVEEREWMREHNVRWGEWETPGGKELAALRDTFDHPLSALAYKGTLEALEREPELVADVVSPMVAYYDEGGWD